jgi:hypothetical protein
LVGLPGTGVKVAVSGLRGIDGVDFDPQAGKRMVMMKRDKEILQPNNR